MTQQKPTDGGSSGQPPALDRVASALYRMNSGSRFLPFGNLPDRRKDLWRSVAKHRAATLAVSAKVELVPAMGQGGPHEETRSVEHFLRAIELATIDTDRLRHDAEIGIPPFGRAGTMQDPDFRRQFAQAADSKRLGPDELRAVLDSDAPLTLATDLSSTKADSLESVTLADLPFPLEEIARAETVVVIDGDFERYLKDRTGTDRIERRPRSWVEFPYAIGSKVLERERQFRIAAGALVGGFVGIAALYLLFWLLPPAVGAVTIVAGWIPWAAAVGGLIMARRS